MLPNEVHMYLQNIATELAFVETHGSNSIKLIGDFVNEIKIIYGSTASPEIINELNKFDLLHKNLLSQIDVITTEQLNDLHDWYQRLEATVRKPYHSPHFLSLPLQSDTSSVTTTAPTSINISDDEPAPVINLPEDEDLLKEFCNGGQDLILNIEQGVLILEKEPNHSETLNLVFRAFHTFKGNAGFLGFTSIKNLAHELESLLDAARKGTIQINKQLIELILAGGDTFNGFLKYVNLRLKGVPSKELPAVNTLELLNKVKDFLNGKTVTQANVPIIAPEAIDEVEVESEILNNSASKFTEDQITLSPEPQIQEPIPTRLFNNTASTSAHTVNTIVSEGGTNFVKLNTEKVDALVDLVGELLIAQSMVVQHPEVIKLYDRDLARHMRQLARITTDLQKNAMSLRMVPIRGAFHKLHRVVRDLASSQGKQIQLQLSGEEIELDRNIVEQLSDPLIHMVRNSVDHGIELPHVRAQSGKPEIGTIQIHAFHQGGGFAVRISDDGRGLDKQKILLKATERGLVSLDSIQNDKDIYDLIFSPGFSTAETVTDISGRGVGMDVVRGSINRLRGRIEVESTFGMGSTFTIRMPLTLAIIDGMLVGIGNERFIIPTLSIRESFRPKPEMMVSVQGSGEVLRVRGKLIPLVRLADQLGIESESQHATEGIVIVTENGPQVHGFLVDRLLGKKEVVIKSLGDSLKDHPGMSGAAILGDGLVALILDPNAYGSNYKHEAQLSAIHLNTQTYAS
jgi:two-component system chemotaxis sensor kinase CheA